jgi:hypothetical protein
VQTFGALLTCADAPAAAPPDEARLVGSRTQGFRSSDACSDMREPLRLATACPSDVTDRDGF